MLPRVGEQEPAEVARNFLQSLKLQPDCKLRQLQNGVALSPNGRPSMLLTALERKITKCDQFRDFIANSGERVHAVVAPPGSGKTRLLLEFCANSPEAFPVLLIASTNANGGAKACETAVSVLNQQATSLEFSLQNRDLAFVYFRSVVLAHICILDWLATKHCSSHVALLSQYYPVAVFADDTDPYSALAEAFRLYSSPHLVDTMLGKLLVQSPRHVMVDEAQVMISNSQVLWVYPSSDPSITEGRPMISAFSQSLVNHTRATITYSGTSFRLRDVDLCATQLAKPGTGVPMWPSDSDIGTSFDAFGSVESMDGHFQLVGCDDATLRKEVFNRLRGRCRWLCVCVEEYLRPCGDRDFKTIVHQFVEEQCRPSSKNGEVIHNPKTLWDVLNRVVNGNVLAGM